MYINSYEMRAVEARARKMRAEVLRNFFASLFSRPRRNVTPHMGKTA